MMHGTLNTDRLCKVLEQILSQRDPNIEVLVKVVSEEEGVELKRLTFDSLERKTLDEL